MPLPPELDRNVRNSFKQLIEHGQDILQGLSPQAEFEFSYIILGEVTSMRMTTQSLARIVLGNTPRGVSVQESIEGVGEGFDGIRELVGILEALQHDHVNGFNLDLEEAILTNISRDYMSQAEALLEEGIPGQYDHVPAAVLCGAVLEDALRRLCLRQTPTIKITKSNGQKKTMEPLIQDLQRSQVINNLEADQLRGWAKIRNYAAHGEFCNFERADVDGMLLGVKHFLAKKSVIFKKQGATGLDLKVDFPL